jgi:hypothetical protein
VDNFENGLERRLTDLEKVLRDLEESILSSGIFISMAILASTPDLPKPTRMAYYAQVQQYLDRALQTLEEGK